MLTADEAFNLTLEKQKAFETIDHLLVIEQRIKEGIEKGLFVVVSDCMLAPNAEKLAVELEEFGYSTSVQWANRMNEHGEPLCHVVVNWRFKPLNTSRVNSEISCN